LPGLVALVVGWPLLWKGLQRLWRTRIQITPDRIRAVARRGHRRDDVTHIFCVRVVERSGKPLWHVSVRVGAVDHVLVITNSPDDATAVAELLASELRLPTWAPRAGQR
jgi:hypothetical protein